MKIALVMEWSTCERNETVYNTLKKVAEANGHTVVNYGQFSMKMVNRKYNLDLSDYRALHQWSVSCPENFWGDLWDFLDIKCSRKFDTVVDDVKKMPGARWFIGARLNYAENMKTSVKLLSESFLTSRTNSNIFTSAVSVRT